MSAELERGLDGGRPGRLRVEHLEQPMGITETAPRLSWWLPSGASEQHAYQLEFDGRAIARVDSADSVLVPWPDQPLVSRQIVTWRVKVWTDLGESDWSVPNRIEVGLLHADDWKAQWIEPRETEVAPSGSRPAYVLRCQFNLDQVAKARLYATAHGIYEVFLNGDRLGDVELAPGFTSYHANLHVQTYDASSLLREGDNTWEVVLSDGWFRGRTGFAQVADCYGDTVAFLGQLLVGDQTIATGSHWEWAASPVIAADLMAGQVEDRTREPAVWKPVVVGEHGFERLTSSPAPPTRKIEDIRPVAVTRPAPDRQVVDLGQNINGWVRMSNLGERGTELTLTHGEALDETGDVTMDHLAPFDYTTREPFPLGQVDKVIAEGIPGETFEPRHTTHGFQYVRVEGHKGRLTPDDVTGVMVHTDLRRTGWFRCSDERINRFHDITVWSFRGNACEVPTDCPQRERAGWTGDYQLFMPAATFLFDVSGFSRKWLRDLIADARPDGCITNYAPDPVRPKGLAEQSPMWLFMQGSSGWGDAITIVPWELWRAYGDRDALAECWPAMVAWVDYAANAARTQSPIWGEARSESPAPHEEFIWNGGFHWGEWLEPGDEDISHEERFGRHKGEIGTAYLHLSSAIAARVGRLLGHDGEAERLELLSANALDAWQTEFIASDGSIWPDTQANHVRALAFGLVPDELRDQTASRLVQLVREADTHLGTGFLATPLLLPALADSGYLDVAYELLHRDTPPSWLAMVERGATTVWEDWDGIGDDGTPKASLNHFSKGAVVSFLHGYVAGIQLLDDEPAYRRFRVAPRPGGGLHWAEAVHDSPYGRIESAWRHEGRRFDLTVTVPPGTLAEINLPDGSTATAEPGTSHYRCKVADLPASDLTEAGEAP